MVMYKIDRRGEGGGSKNRSLGNYRPCFVQIEKIITDRVTIELKVVIEDRCEAP